MARALRLLLVPLLFARPALGSRVVRADLDEVVDDAEVVFEARVMAYQETRTRYEIRGHYDVQLADAPDVHARLVYAEDLPRPMESGGMRSPLVTGSGLEPLVEVGSSYVFLVRSPSHADTSLELLRVEPLDRAPLVMSAWRMSLFRRVAKPLELPITED